MKEEQVSFYLHPREFPEPVRRLFDTAEREHFCSGSWWYENYLHAVADAAAQPGFYVLWCDGQALAVLPIAQKAARWPGHTAIESLSNYYTTLYQPILAPGLSPGLLAHLLSAMLRAHRPVTALRLQPLARDTQTYATLLAAVRHAGLVPFEFMCFGNWYLRDFRDWSGYLAQRTSKLRSNIKRMEKKLLADGATIEVVLNREQAAAAVADYETVYASSWKKAEPYPRFIPGLVAACAERGWLRLGVIRLGGKPIAAQIWLVAHGRAEIYKVAYDEAWKEYSPGTVLTARLMEHVIAIDHVHEVDFLMGDDAYKRMWMSHRRERWGVLAFNPRSIGGLAGLLLESLRRGLRPIVQRWRGSPGPAPAN